MFFIKKKVLKRNVFFSFLYSIDFYFCVIFHYTKTLLVMKKEILFKWLIISILVLFNGKIIAQQSRHYHSPEHEFTRAKELFDKQQYGSAKSLFTQVYQKIEDNFDTRKQTSLFHMALCATILYHDDAEQLAYYFASEYPQYMDLDRMWFHLGEYFFTKKQYKKALVEYQKINPKILTEEEKASYEFKMAYGYFIQDMYAEAKPLFSSVMQSENDYKNKSIFYYSHILYTEKSYNAALQGFTRLINEETYSEIVPFYVAHIYFGTERYNEIIAQKDELLSKSSKKRLPEINGIIAQSYFQIQKYREAIPYFEEHIKTNSNTACEIYYMIGYCYYKNNQYSNAIDNLTQSICSNDSINQYAYYTLGDCYLQNNQKEFASRAFLSAYEKGNNARIKEDALFQYAKLQYELASNPFLSAISAFEKYLNEYANSARRNEVETFLSSIYLTTKNYKAAIVSLEKITNKSTTLLKAYQRVTYYRGLEFFNENNYEEAEQYFNISLSNNYDAAIYAQTLFWKSEIDYRRENYKQAANGFTLFLNNSKSKEVVEYPMCFYNLAYAEFKQKKYSSATTRFKEFLSFKNQIADYRLIADAYNRLGDCAFMQSQLESAHVYYSQAVEMNVYDVDYALFQKAQTEGSLRQYDTKNNTMKELIERYPSSSYIADAQYEIANTFFSAGKIQEALNAYDNFITQNPKNQLVKSALLKKGSIYYNNNQDEKALEVYKQIVANYPHTDEAGTALKSIENIYVASGNVDDFFNYVRNVSSDKITVSFQDSVTYNAASEQYFSKNFIEAEKGFEQYINRFPDGVFILKANYYKGECALRRNDFISALPAYEYVIQHKGEEQFLFPSLQNAARIQLADSNYKQAIVYYKQLNEHAPLTSQKIEGLHGQTLCYYHLKDFNNALILAQQLSAEEHADLSQKELGHLIAARSAIAIDSFALAEKEYTILSKGNSTESASEALYYLAYINYLSNDMDKTEKRIFDMLVNITHDYWLAKSYILLGDVYLAKGNSFQAKHTYMSIIENYDGEDLKTIATEKYNAIIAQEQKNSQTNQNVEDSENEIIK